MGQLSLFFSFTILTIILITGGARATPPDCSDLPGAYTVEGAGFLRPESAHWDKKEGVWYLSNQGSPTDPTDGFISKLHPDGSVAKLHWATGLGHPLGIRIFEDRLYVADRDHMAFGHSVIAAYDLADGSKAKTYSLSPTLLNLGGPNDPVIDRKSDAIYVSVFALNPAVGNTVLKIPLSGDGSDAEQLVPPDSIGPQPNGTLMFRHDLLVMNSHGEFLLVDVDTGEIESLGASSFIEADTFPRGVMDGVERVGGAFLYTLNGLPGTGIPSLLATIRFQPDGTVKEEMVCTLAPDEGAADIGIDRDGGVVAIPHLFTHKVTFVSLDAIPH